MIMSGEPFLRFFIHVLSQKTGNFENFFQTLISISHEIKSKT